METEDVNTPITIDGDIDMEHVNIIEDDDMAEAEGDNDVELEQTEDNNRKRGRKQSIVWDHFNKPKSARTTCKHCKKSYVYEPSRNGTSTLLTHLKILCKFNPLKRQKDIKQKTCFQGKGEGGKLVCGRFTKELELPSQNTIARDILSLYVDENKKLKQFLGKSSQSIGICKKMVLNFEVISNHRGDTIGKMIESCLIAWGIEKVFTITVDNASSNDTAIFLKKKIKNWGNAILDVQYLHMRCCAHVLNLVVCDGLKDYDPSIQVVRNAMRYVRLSPSRLAKFKECVKIKKLDISGSVCLDVSTRWNSTYLILETALKFRKAFNRLEEDGQYARYFNVGSSTLFGEEDAKKKGMIGLKLAHQVIVIGILQSPL
ncbi:zinc finger BED domain-containing protein RICESLEEPER 2-like [Bidens hawaiensis]|uniref:zinc finger BED domain-containing protein RICESLEEPER 2-like n=1 Tax=Bidens hawaiensis TaxID=980011 RepID=UPI00404B0CEA